jgi:hypothetical protein
MQKTLFSPFALNPRPNFNLWEKQEIWLQELKAACSLFISPLTTLMPPKVLVTRVLPPQTQACLLEQDFELDQWQDDCSIPREVLLSRVKGTYKQVRARIFL